MSLASTAPHIKQAATAAGLVGCDPRPDAIEGRPESSGLVLYRQDDGAELVVEAGLWSCTPGAFRLSRACDELLYVLAGRATYTEHNGETVEAASGHVPLCLQLLGDAHAIEGRPERGFGIKDDRLAPGHALPPRTTAQPASLARALAPGQAPSATAPDQGEAK
jgi:uncharacterized protein